MKAIFIMLLLTTSCFQRDKTTIHTPKFDSAPIDRRLDEQDARLQALEQKIEQLSLSVTNIDNRLSTLSLNVSLWFTEINELQAQIDALSENNTEELENRVTVLEGKVDELFELLENHEHDLEINPVVGVVECGEGQAFVFADNSLLEIRVTLTCDGNQNKCGTLQPGGSALKVVSVDLVPVLSCE